MEPIEFPEQNMIFAKDQPEYLPLPAYVDRNDPNQPVIFCWRLTWRERLRLLVTGKIWHSVLTFHQILQPQMLHVESPFRVPAVDETVDG